MCVRYSMCVHRFRMYVSMGEIASLVCDQRKRASGASRTDGQTDICMEKNEKEQRTQNNNTKREFSHNRSNEFCDRYKRNACRSFWWRRSTLHCAGDHLIANNCRHLPKLRCASVNACVLPECQLALLWSIDTLIPACRGHSAAHIASLYVPTWTISPIVSLLYVRNS